MDYFNSLQIRSKWKIYNPNIQIGDVVIIKEDNIPSSVRPLVKVVSTHPRKDGVVRAVTLKTLKDAASKCKLPEIQLPSSGENPREWLNFCTLFQKVHEEASIDDRNKYQYLTQSTVLVSAPREIVESFPATAQNYKKAVEYLMERFGKETVLKQLYIRDLLQLVISKNKCELSSLYDKLQTRIQSLASLGLTKEKYADILFPLVESILPIDIV
ncbi:hypothetical protein AVEN_72474-1 [Araneus ventricosus]|uniref:DUF5641 domain-containing protein n=1 Tax=Araneus ventricosus TaxID=182803 RepID=A0A4Y2G4N7_ARAVE|nr:hypothetical protein AVEN_72474-1 [Araneus ventricosus]